MAVEPPMVPPPAGPMESARPTPPAVAPVARGDSAPAWFTGKLLFWALWPPLVAADLWSKAAVFAFLADKLGRPGAVVAGSMPVEHEVFDGWVSFRLVAWGNPGTVWGLFPDATGVLMVLRCAAILGLLWFVRRTAAQSRLQLIVLGLIFAGAVGNLYDNFTRGDRTVRDFLRFTGDWPWAWEFPAFNVADSCITVGAFGLFWLLWREDRRAARRPGTVS